MASVCCLDAIPTTISNGVAVDSDWLVLTSLYAALLSGMRALMQRVLAVVIETVGGGILVWLWLRCVVWMPYQRRCQMVVQLTVTCLSLRHCTLCLCQVRGL